jgi:asparagine synthase (glutamine-hydrolysing)
MSHGLEVRVPFLDLEMINLSEQIRPELTIKHKIPKYITKEILKRYIANNPTNEYKVPIRESKIIQIITINTITNIVIKNNICP